MSGQTFGQLTVVARATNAKGRNGNRGNTRDRVRCACGYVFVVRHGWLARGRITSCDKCAGRGKYAR